MQILFTGNKPQKKTYSYSVKENNNSNIITFVLNKVQEDLDLSTLSCFVKVQGKEIDKDVPNVEVVEDKIHVNWTLLRKHTESRMLSVQLQFEGHDDIVWQTDILQLVLSDTIKADEYIENKYPAVLTNHEERITDLEGGAVSDPLLHQSDIVDNLESEATQKPLSANQGRILNNKINTAISGVMHYKGSVATYDDLPTENVKVGDLYNIIKNDSNYAWTGSEWDMVGSSVDLSNYYNKSETDALLDEKADKTELPIIEIKLESSETEYGLIIPYISNNKIVKVIGTMGGNADPVFFPQGKIGTDFIGFMICRWLVSPYRIRADGSWNSSSTLTIDNLFILNKKNIPTYPTDITKQYKLVQKVGGNLDYVEDKEEILIKLDTGTYSSGTPMSDNDYEQLYPLTQLSFEELSKLRITFMIKYSNQNETYTTKTYVIRNSQVGFTGGWHSIEMYVSWFINNFSIFKQNIINKTY